MLTESNMHDCVVKLLKSNDEESFECLCKLLVTIGKDLDHKKAKPRVDQYFAQINKIILARKTSSRVRFMMQDIVDLRSNGWVPRREDNNPKTIDQIHREANDQAKKTQMAIQIARKDRRLQQRGNTGGRDSPRAGAIPQADESWTTVGRGPRNVSVDPKKFQNIKRPVDSENISLGPGGRGYGAWARGSSGGSGAVGAGAGPSAAASAGSSIAGVSAETDNRPANRYSVIEAVRAELQRQRASQDRGSGRESPRTTAEVALATDSGAGSAALAASQEVKDFRGEIALQEPQEKELQQENLERQLVVLQQQLREKEQCLANYRAQLEERNLTETNLIQQLQQQEHQQENSQRQLRGMEEQIRENKDDKANLEKQVEVLQQQLIENQQCLTIYRAQLEERNLRETRLIRQLQEKELQGENSQRLLQEMEEQIREKEDDKANSERQLREMVQSFEERIRGKEEQKTNLETQLEMKNQQLREIETSLSAAQQMIIELRRQESCDWAISRDEIQVKDKYLGKGAWGSVNEATYCGCIVAVKQIHELILSPHNRRLFEREMNIASRCRHPCLLQFIGATNDEGSPLFVTELMELSLRALLEKRQLTETEISVISLDVSRALNYLHHMKPSPIVHRDVSSANVLLWRQGEQWRGKVSDYGTAKFVQQTMTVAPGALIYSAPEAVSSNQTSKVDVYSFGVLLCEMCIREMPDPERREEQVLVVKNRNFRNLVRQCLQADPAMRPDMAQIIQELEQV